ncbi:MAG: 1,4-alpha-glucan branching protein GlgB [Defluviitaleaceae bacterium]|nr:1,4-alpha-glucan branching protein GlgB [Defluviitaleaceae bacterium]
MIKTTMHELTQIVNGEHADPHHVLGMHDITSEQDEYTVVRVFNPSAAKVEVFNPKKLKERYTMELEHKMGFFIAVLPRQKHFRYKLAFTGHDGNVWESWDAYSFAPAISEMDLHLFGQGTHYEIYNKLGATPMKIDGIDGVLFGVWAPNAKRISVVGDFNDWNGLRNPMRTLGNSGVWELFIPGLKNYDRYKFEISSHTGGFFHKSDPYAFFAELRPETASMVFDIKNYKWEDSQWIKNRTKKDPLDGPVNIYEFHAGSWRKVAEDGWRFMSWPEITKELIPYVKDMGYTHIELMPVTEYPFDGSWGYQVTGYYAATSRYGNPLELKAFIDACHQNNIGVIMDWVPAHFPKDAHGLAWFDGSKLYEHEDPRQGEHPDWGTLIFNYGRNEVKNFLIANALFWINEYHIDGLRVDAVASMLYLDYGKQFGQWVPNEYGGRENFEAVEFMKHMNSILFGKHPHVMMIAEESTAWTGVTRPAKYDGLGFSLKWNMGWMNDFLEYMSKDSVYRKHHHHNLTFSMVYAYSEKYILVLSHDEVVHGKGSLVNKMPGDTWQKMANLRVAFGYMMGHPGKKLLFMGGEFAQFDEWSEERTLDWFLLDEYEHHRQMKAFVKDINHLYLKEKALWQKDFDSEGFQWISCQDAERSIISFYRVSETRRRSKADQEAKGSTFEYLVFICNFTPYPHLDYRTGLPALGRYVEILNSDDEKYGGSGIINSGNLIAEEHLCDGRAYSVSIQLPPLGVVILKG